jgi:hypothetical protein
MRVLALVCVVAVLALAVAGALYRSALIGWWRGEAQYRGRYTNSWDAEVRHWRIVGYIGGNGHCSPIYSREPSWWLLMLDKLGCGRFMDRSYPVPSILEGCDPAAAPVLVELLRSPNSNVRILAATALAETGPGARDALAALRALQDDEDSEVRWAAETAIWEIEESPVHSSPQDADCRPEVP